MRIWDGMKRFSAMRVPALRFEAKYVHFPHLEIATVESGDDRNPEGEDMRENDEREIDPTEHLEMILRASGQASLCLALCASCIDAFPDIASYERECLDAYISAAEASTAAIRWAAESCENDKNSTFHVLSMVERIRWLCADICDLCAQMCDTYVIEGRRGQHYRICADLCRSLAFDCRPLDHTVH